MRLVFYPPHFKCCDVFLDFLGSVFLLSLLKELHHILVQVWVS